MRPFVGFTGSVCGPLIFGAVLLCRWLPRRGSTFNLDPKDEPGKFEPLLAKYIKASEFIIGIATGSIVLLVGSSVIRVEGGSVSMHGGHLPWFFSSPLILLGWSVMLGVAFMVWEIFCYEEYQHGNPHTAFAYSMAEALGFGSLLCFCLGYMMLIFLVTRP